MSFIRLIWVDMCFFGVSVPVHRVCVYTDQCLVVNLLSDEFVLAQRIAGLSCDRVYRTLLHLLLHGTIQHKERLASTLLDEEEGKGRQEEGLVKKQTKCN